MNKLLVWTPRILMMIYIGFIASFAVDSLCEASTLLGKIGDFLMHLIPAVLTAGLLFVAWNYRIIGGLLIMVLGMVFTIYFGTGNSLPHFMMISFPLMLSGVLFIFSNWHAVTVERE